MRILPALLVSFCLALGAMPALAQPKPAAPITPRPNAPTSFSQLTARLLPTVVQITTSQTLNAPARGNLPNLPEDSPLSELFKNFLGPRGNQPHPFLHKECAAALIEPDKNRHNQHDWRKHNQTSRLPYNVSSTTSN